MTPDILRRSSSCPSGLHLTPDRRGMPSPGILKEKIKGCFMHGKSVAIAQNTEKAVKMYTLLRSEFNSHELTAVRECIQGYILGDKPLCNIHQRSIEQGLLCGAPTEVSPDHTAQFVSRLVHVKVLGKDQGVICAGQELKECAAFIYHKLPQNEIITSPALHSSSNSR